MLCAVAAAPAPAAPAAAPAPAPAAAAPKAAEAPAPAAPAVSGVEISAPMSGTVYRRPAPGEPLFVKEGDKVAKGQSICIIEVRVHFSSGLCRSPLPAAVPLLLCWIEIFDAPLALQRDLTLHQRSMQQAA